MSTMKWVMVGALIATLASTAHAQTLTKEGTVTATATITAIDSATRSLTLRNDKGEEDTFTAGPEVTRFNQLKVGDKIRLTYHESLVLQLRKPGAASNSTGDTVAAGRTQAVPGGAVASPTTRTAAGGTGEPPGGPLTGTTPGGGTIT